MPRREPDGRVFVRGRGLASSYVGDAFVNKKNIRVTSPNTLFPGETMTAYFALHGASVGGGGFSSQSIEWDHPETTLEKPE